MSDLKEKKSLANALDRIRKERAIEGDDGDALEYAALALGTYGQQRRRLRTRIEQLEAALRKIEAKSSRYRKTGIQHGSDYWHSGLQIIGREARQALGDTQ